MTDPKPTRLFIEVTDDGLTTTEEVWPDDPAFEEALRKLGYVKGGKSAPLELGKCAACENDADPRFLEGDALKCKKDAPVLKAEPFTVEFVAALLRKAAEVQERRESEASMRGYERGVASQPEREPATGEEHHWKRQHDQLKTAVDAFRAASGVEIDRWHHGNIGEAVKLLLGHIYRPTAEYAPSKIDIAASTLERLAKDLRREEKTLEKALELVREKSSEGTAAE